ncbi:DUF721 domain-containing protein [Pendulispora brunnea]|uniref:DUF721 domain-containing protein n=1 Tax=Pendulispora brunnea TaxID=2905690 RepID=A0ABZ2KMR9_9BACT
MNRRRKRPKLREPEGIETVLERAGDSRFARRQAPIPLQTWTRAVGLRIADRAKPWSLERGVLTVRVPSSVWASELSMLAASVISRLRDAGVEVAELRFRVAPLEPPQRPPERRISRAVPPPLPVPRDLEASLALVEDPELREALRYSASHSLAWQDYHERSAGQLNQRNAASRSKPSRR